MRFHAEGVSVGGRCHECGIRFVIDGVETWEEDGHINERNATRSVWLDPVRALDLSDEIRDAIGVDR